YGQLGEPEGLNIEHAKSAMAAQQRQNSEAFVQTVAKLEQKLQQEPSNLEGWMMLAKSYRYLGQSQKVVGVYERALQQSGAGENPQLLLDYGEALAEQRGGDWRGEPIQQLNRALALDPTHNDALWLAGHIHFDQGEYEQALGYWERLSNVIPSEDPEIVEMINQAGFKAQQKLGRLQQPLMKMAEAVAEMVLTVSVSIDSALQEHVEASDTVFIYAKAAERGGPPLAAQRLTVADLPVTIRLDDSMAMIPGNNLSSVERVTVGAKVSKSGVATGGSGDLVGSIEVLTSQQEVVELTIDQRVE
ncbi:MAG: tetratricopeptide repeat protein, partial [Gammaproteobacteria bacterium]|nr:tetratricopeptide repeat protein [Gammaproteobacteria bacterium]